MNAQKPASLSNTTVSNSLTKTPIRVGVLGFGGLDKQQPESSLANAKCYGWQQQIEKVMPTSQLD